MRINTNLTAMNTYTQYTKNQNKISSAVAKLSSGYAINTAADNAAGLAISEKMRAQIRGLDKASSNAQDAISLVQTAEGALSSSTEILQRMREIAVQSSSDTNNDSIDRTALQDEFSQLQGELNDIASNTTFNKKNLLDGSLSSKSTNINNVTLANSGMALSAGAVDAGQYKFNVSVKQETAAIASKAGTTTAALGNTAKSLFTTASGTGPSTSGALYNGNYTLTTTVNEDKTLTVTAKGDNDQVFKATVSKTALDNVDGTAWSSGEGIDLKFESSAGANDGFGATLTLGQGISTSANGLDALSSAINDVTVSVDGGVDAQAATYGVYASMTGGENVKLHTGDTSVTFSNGVTVGFDKMSATDAAVSLKTTSVSTSTLSASATVTAAATSGNASTFSIDLDNVIAGTYTQGDLKTYDLKIGSSTFSYTTTGKEADSGAVADAFAKAIGDKSTVSVTSTDASHTTATFTSDYSTYDNTNNVLTFKTGTTINNADLTTATGSTVTLAFSSTPATSATITSASISSGLAGKVGTSADQATAGTNSLEKTTDTTFTISQEANAGLTFQVGANEGDQMTINIEKMDAQTLGVKSAKVDTQAAAKAAVTSVDSAINQVSAMRANLGAIQNRLEYKIDNLSTSSTNLTSAESQIRDVDMAKQMTDFTNANILSQAATAMLAQANSLPQSVLSLIGK